LEKFSIVVLILTKKEREDMKNGFTLTELLTVIMIVAIISGVFVQPYFEMKAFNKFSSNKATYIDAMFSQLRIEANRVSN